MKQIYNMFFIGIIIVVITLVGCSAPRIALHESTIESMNDRPLAVGDSSFAYKAGDFYNHVVISRMLMNGGTYESDEANHIFDSLLLDTLASVLAYYTPIEDDYLSYKQFKHQYYDFLLNRYWTETLYKKTSTDSLEAVEYYNEHPELFTVEEQVNLYHILCSPFGLTLGKDSAFYSALTRDDLWVKTKEYADNLHKLLDFGEAFENVAYSYSHDVSTKEAGGFVGWTTRNVYLDPFDSVAFQLKPGEYSKPYRDKDGWHLIYIDAIQPAGPVPIDSPSVYISALQTVLTAKSNDAIAKRRDSLLSAVKLVFNEAVLDTNIYYLHDSVWLAVVNGMDTVDARDAKMFEEGYRKKYDVDNTTAEQKKEMIKDASERYIQVQAARANGIEEIPAVVAERDRLYRLRSKMMIQKDQYDFKWTPTVEQLKEYYETQIDDYIVLKPTKIEILTVRDSAFGEFLRDQVESGFDISDVIKEHNGTGDQRASSSGQYYVGNDELDLKLRVVMARTSVGAVTELIKSENGSFQFVKIIDRKDSREFYRAQGEIKILLQKQHAKEVWDRYRASIFKRLNIKVPIKLSSIHLENYHVRNAEH